VYDILPGNKRLKTRIQKYNLYVQTEDQTDKYIIP